VVEVEVEGGEAGHHGEEEGEAVETVDGVLGAGRGDVVEGDGVVWLVLGLEDRLVEGRGGDGEVFDV